MNAKDETSSKGIYCKSWRRVSNVSTMIVGLIKGLYWGAEHCLFIQDQMQKCEHGEVAYFWAWDISTAHAQLRPHPYWATAKTTSLLSIYDIMPAASLLQNVRNIKLQSTCPRS